MKKSKTFKIILLILILIFTFLTIRNTYSKYITQTGNSSTLNISKWHLLLNDEDIRNKKDFTEDIKIEYEKSEHIAENVVVPTSKGTFSLELNSTGTELPFEYTIQITDDKPYIVTVNNITTGDDTSPYLYDITLNVKNNNSTLTNWNLDFELPATILQDNSTFDTTDTYKIENNILKIESQTEFTQSTTKTIHMILAFANEINFEITNINLNGIPLYDPTDIIADFRITSYNLNGTEFTVPSHESKITGIVIPPEDLTKEVINSFSFTVEWYDKENNMYNNFEDVEAIKNGLPAIIPIKLSVTQLNVTTQNP